MFLVKKKMFLVSFCNLIVFLSFLLDVFFILYGNFYFSFSYFSTSMKMKNEKC